MNIVVTTVTRPDPAQVARAHAIALRCSSIYVEKRTNLEALLEASGAELIYIVGRAKDQLWSPQGSISVVAGLTVHRLHNGLENPLVRAVGPASRIIDATLGLAQDALHLAGTLDCDVVGIEASPAVYSLLEEGLPRLAAEDSAIGRAAARISPTLGVSAEVMAAMPDDSADAVFLSPMFAKPRKAPPGYALFRSVAVHTPLDAATVTQALRVSPRLVMKVGSGDPVPPALAGRHPQRVEGRAVDHLVVGR